MTITLPSWLQLFALLGCLGAGLIVMAILVNLSMVFDPTLDAKWTYEIVPKLDYLLLVIALGGGAAFWWFVIL